MGDDLTHEDLLTTTGVDTSLDVMHRWFRWTLVVTLALLLLKGRPVVVVLDRIPDPPPLGSRHLSLDDLRGGAGEDLRGGAGEDGIGRPDGIRIAAAEPDGSFSFIPRSGGG